MDLKDFLRDDKNIVFDFTMVMNAIAIKRLKIQLTDILHIGHQKRNL